MAVIARCLLHVVYEFQAFLNLFAKQSLGLSSGMAAQVGRAETSTLRMQQISTRSAMSANPLTIVLPILRFTCSPGTPL